MFVEHWDDDTVDESMRVKHLANYLIELAIQKHEKLSLEKLHRILTDVHSFTLVSFSTRVFHESPSCMGDYPLYESIHDLLVWQQDHLSWRNKLFSPGLQPLCESLVAVPEGFKQEGVYLTPAKSFKALLELLNTIYRFYMDNADKDTFILTTGPNSAYALARRRSLLYISEDILLGVGQRRAGLSQNT